ncbi:preprotein translocase subunit SecE [Akkermansia glycaniphila]|uniref:Sece/sec61-gamma subunits of protein translocation complex n=1 Tax=Akkermansia glycaniphila TaxID=1679444 RepID=A0A1C7PB74_9BACT|nr:preprotein translocase subunit SecE [Akkermansia glycaniphila]MBT9448813.1 preprotein translocase subunit SecE [Akkermansia glycaniphila]OCA02836.1 preprotein translocase subunit SecE [Akkermansia glycaniphila]SEH75410.1 sece/sec61-gamma subunits of protein translocation complex [Akkermansia glycaniphila]
MFRRISQYITEIKSELKKCSWPWESDPKVRGFRKYRELSGSTIVVLIAMVLLGAYVSLFDLILAAIVNGTITGLS